MLLGAVIFLLFIEKAKFKKEPLFQQPLLELFKTEIVIGS